jgi:hypothetical protein
MVLADGRYRGPLVAAATPAGRQVVIVPTPAGSTTFTTLSWR